ncbi:hypothetical protein BGX28_000797 [Mortierella sp. GBA30]|nr:hypothetical protein BGX28_000797 [Mortierella sp. GBA30]
MNTGHDDDIDEDIAIKRASTTPPILLSRQDTPSSSSSSSSTHAHQPPPQSFAQVQPSDQSMHIYNRVQPQLDHPDSVIPDPSNILHRALVSMLGDMIIPVFPGTDKVDFSRVRRTVFPGAPEFHLDSILASDYTRDHMALEFLKGFTEFMEQFREFFLQNLSSILFDRFAWSYMVESLKSNRILATQYDQAIRLYPHDQRDWNRVARCLERILKLRFFRVELLKQLIAARPEPYEDGPAYADRLQLLVKLARGDREGMDRFAISVIAESLPDGGYERMKVHFGSDENIKSVQDILQFIRKTPGVLSGRTTDRAEWIWRHFALRNRKRT